MRKVMILTAAALAITSLEARAQTDLKAYTDANGYLDRAEADLRPTCRDLARGRRQAHGLVSGWYNGLAKKYFFHPSRGVRLEHEVIVHCKANPEILGHRRDLALS